MKALGQCVSIAVIAMAMALSPAQAQVTWTGGDYTWSQPDSDSFDTTFTSGANVIFGNTGVTTGVSGSGSAIVWSGTRNVGDMIFTHKGGYISLLASTGHNYVFDSQTSLSNVISGTGNLVVGQGGVVFRLGVVPGILTHTFAGNLIYSGGSMLSLSSETTTRKIRLQVSNMATPTAGNSILFTTIRVASSTTEETPGLGWSAADNHLIVTGSKPSLSPHGTIVHPGVQFVTGVSANGNFMSFSGDALVPTATYDSTNINTAGSNDVVNLATGTQTLTSNNTIYALRLIGTLNLGSNTLTIAGGGLIIGHETGGISKTVGNSSATIDFGSSPAFIGGYRRDNRNQIAARITGSGGLTIMGNNLELTNNSTTNPNTFTGGIYVNSGVVRLVENAANNNDVTVGGLGRLTTLATTDVIGGLSGSGWVSGWYRDLGSSTGTLSINPASGVYTFDGRLTNGQSGRVLAIIKGGAGTQVFGPESVASYTGTTQVNAGTLLIHGNFTDATGAVTVAGGARLGGTGIIGGNTATLATSSILSPGASAGTLTFNQNLDLAQGATLEFELGTPVSNQDLIVVNGTLTSSTSAAGLQFQFSSLSGFTTGTPYQLFRFTNSSGLDYSDLWMATAPGPGISLDTTYGTGGWNITPDALYVQFIPEPNSVMLLGLGTTAFLLLRRRAKELRRSTTAHS